jgi:hypothetical protein
MTQVAVCFFKVACDRRDDEPGQLPCRRGGQRLGQVSAPPATREAVPEVGEVAGGQRRVDGEDFVTEPEQRQGRCALAGPVRTVDDHDPFLAQHRGGPLVLPGGDGHALQPLAVVGCYGDEADCRRLVLPGPCLPGRPG